MVVRNRWVPAVALTLVTASLAGCFGGGSPYCDAVEKNEKTLNSFGAERTDEAYASYAKAASTIADEAPKEIAADWKAIADGTQAVIAAQEASGVPLEDMDDSAVVAELPADQREALNAAYQTFNDTVEQRKSVVADIDDRCGITLQESEAKE